MKRIHWTDDEYRVVLDLYYKLKQSGETMGMQNPRVDSLAKKMNRPASSVAMRLQNFAYLDTGKGLTNISSQCKVIFAQDSRGGSDHAPAAEPDLPQPVAVPEVAPASSDIPVAKINEIVLSVAMQLNDISRVKNDSFDLFLTLGILIDGYKAAYITHEDLRAISAAAKKLPHDLRATLYPVVIKVIGEKDGAGLIDFINLF